MTSDASREDNIKAIANANFYSLNGTSKPDEMTEEYRKYRESWILYPEQFYVREYPLHLDIEASSLCNLRCSFCDKLPLLKKNQLGNMTFNTFRTIIDQFEQREPLWGIKLSYRGEPLMNKDLPKMVAYAKNKGILDVYFNTNGMLLTENISKKLIEAHLDRISISIDGTTKEEYEKIRIGANLETVVNNLSKLQMLKKHFHVSYPKIRIQTVYFEGMDLNNYSQTWMKYADEVAAIDYKDESYRNTDLVFYWACPQLWQRMTIEWDGSIFGCNNDDLRAMYLGNINEKSIKEFWHDPRLENIRILHKRGESHLVKACNGCPWRTAQINKILRKEKKAK